MEKSPKKVVKRNAITDHPFLSLLFILIGFTVIFGVLENSLRNSTSIPRDVRLERDYRVAVFGCAKNELLTMLKSPSTADFPSASDSFAVDFVQSNKNSIQFNASSFVDAENSFGAVTRSNFSCEVLISPDKTRCVAECIVN